MKKYILKSSFDFKNDLQEVYEYTERTWGKKQANAYHEMIMSKLGCLTENPHIGKPRIDISEKHRSLLIGGHFAFYFVAADSIYLSRLLHHAADITKHEIPS